MDIAKFFNFFTYRICGDGAFYVPCDMRSRDSVHKMCQDISKVHTNGVDILVNNAGKESLYLQHVEYKLNFNVISEQKNHPDEYFYR